MNRKMIKVIWRKHKTAMIVGVGAIGFAILLAASALVGTAYLAINNSNAHAYLDRLQKTGDLNPSNQNFTVITDLALNLTRHTFTESLRSGDLNQLVDGIVCVKSIGGPDPKVVIDHLKSKMADQMLTSRLVEIEQALASGINGRASGSCLNWFLNS